jgi:hypothetical protein
MRMSREPIAAASTFRSLVQLCVAELRGDVEHLFESDWATPERSRILELATVLNQACERQELPQLAILARSMTRLVRLSREEAAPLYPALRKQFKQLFLLAEQCLSRQRRTG